MNRGSPLPMKMKRRGRKERRGEGDSLNLPVFSSLCVSLRPLRLDSSGLFSYQDLQDILTGYHPRFRYLMGL